LKYIYIYIIILYYSSRARKKYKMHNSFSSLFLFVYIYKFDSYVINKTELKIIINYILYYYFHDFPTTSSTISNIYVYKMRSYFSI